jgi:hypothetical protein
MSDTNSIQFDSIDTFKDAKDALSELRQTVTEICVGMRDVDDVEEVHSLAFDAYSSIREFEEEIEAFERIASKHDKRRLSQISIELRSLKENVSVEKRQAITLLSRDDDRDTFNQR